MPAVDGEVAVPAAGDVLVVPVALDVLPATVPLFSGGRRSPQPTSAAAAVSAASGSSFRCMVATFRIVQGSPHLPGISRARAPLKRLVVHDGTAVALRARHAESRRRRCAPPASGRRHDVWSDAGVRRYLLAKRDWLSARSAGAIRSSRHCTEERCCDDCVDCGGLRLPGGQPPAATRRARRGSRAPSARPDRDRRPVPLGLGRPRCGATPRRAAVAFCHTTSPRWSCGLSVAPRAVRGHGVASARI